MKAEEKTYGDITVSIIVPVYNVEKYLMKCIESIQQQTEEKIEIILVDDGSIDKSGEICDEYAVKDSRIKIVHKENGGLSDARNCGLDVSIGEYVAFVDADDYVDKEYISKMKKEMLAKNCDIVQCGYKRVYQDGSMKNFGATAKISSGKDVQRYFYEHGKSEPYVIACNKLYRRSCFDTIRFPVGRIHEDYATTYKIFYEASAISTIEDSLYYYVMRNGSIMQTENEKSLYHWAIAEKERWEFYTDKGMPFLASRAKKAYYYRLRDCINHKNTKNKDELIAERKILKKQMVRSSDYSMKEKVGLLIGEI